MKIGVFAVFATWCLVLAAIGLPAADARNPGGTGFETRPSGYSSTSVGGDLQVFAPQRTAMQQSAARATAAPPADHGALLTQYCITCHNERAKTGGLVLDA